MVSVMASVMASASAGAYGYRQRLSLMVSAEVSLMVSPDSACCRVAAMVFAAVTLW